MSTLLENYRNSQLKDSLYRSITFLALSHSNQPLEVQYFQSFISLESFCDGFSSLTPEETKIPSSAWKKIETALSTALKSLSGDSNRNRYVERIRKKLPELKGITTIDKLLYCCITLNIETSDLWPQIGLEAGLRKSIHIRNHLFHRAHIEPPISLYGHLVRLRVLTERLILKHLEWPDGKISRLHTQPIDWSKLKT